MKIKKLTIKILLSGFFFILCSSSIYAGFGISPTDVTNEYLKPGASFEREFTISRSESLEEMDIYIEPDLSDIDSWFTYSPGKVFKLNQGEDIKTFKVITSVPSDAEYKSYTGVIRVKAVPSAGDVQGISITQGVRLDVNLVVTQEDIRSLSIISITTSDAEVGQPIQIKIEGENLGNVDASPTVKIKLMSLAMDVLEEKDVANFGFVKPNEKSTLTAEFTSSLPVGEYFMQVSVLLDNQELRSERLVLKINESTGASVTPVEDTGITLISQIRNFTKENKTFITYISLATLVAIGIEVAVYSLTNKLGSKLLRNSLSKSFINKIKYVRAVISFLFAFLIFLGFVFIPILNKSSQSSEKITQVKGVFTTESNDSALNVLPPVSVKQYLIYEKPDTSSKSVYTASEDEKFTVTEENDDWYRVILSNQETGWLEKSMVKSVISNER